MNLHYSKSSQSGCNSRRDTAPCANCDLSMNYSKWHNMRNLPFHQWPWKQTLKSMCHWQGIRDANRQPCNGWLGCNHWPKNQGTALAGKFLTMATSTIQFIHTSQAISATKGTHPKRNVTKSYSKCTYWFTEYNQKITWGSIPRCTYSRYLCYIGWPVTIRSTTHLIFRSTIFSQIASPYF